MCVDCFNGCSPEATSDKCVKYTGPDNVTLGICQGEPLASVETKLINAINALITGTNDTIYSITNNCTFFQSQIGNQTYTLNHLLDSLVKGECSLKKMIDDINAVVTAPIVLDQPCFYIPAYPTRDQIITASVTEICKIQSSVSAIASDYVKASQLNSSIAAYLASTAPTSPSGVTQQYTKMVPYVAYEYYGPLSNFDSTGIGLSANSFEKVYLCNGLHGTPDKRGRVAVGAIANVPGGTLDTEVDPTLPANAGKNWTLLQKFGKSSVTLDTTMIPAHTHPVVDPGHQHDVNGTPTPWHPASDGVIVNINGTTVGKTVAAKTGITIGSAGSSLAHENMPPAIGAYFIMYLP